MNLFVEDYRSLQRARADTGRVVVRTQTRCSRCGNPMDSEAISCIAFLRCDVCRGWWLPHGCLTRLNRAYRGAAVPIEIHEDELYLRAAARHRARNGACPDRPARHQTHANSQRLWFWVLFFGLALALGGVIFIAGIGKALKTSPWTKLPEQTLLYVWAGFFGGIGLVIHGWLVHQRKRLIENIPTSTIRSLALGLVEISGRAQPEAALLSAPFSGLPCVFYAYAVEEQVGSGKNARWETVATGTSEQPFYVNDTTGRVLVLPLGAERMLPDERTYQNDWWSEVPPRVMNGLTRLGISSDRLRGRKTVRCRETFILPKAPVYVLGTAQAYQGVKESLENPARLYIGSSHNNEFIISDRSEKELLSRLRWQAWACLVVGLIVIAACLITLFAYSPTTVS